MWRIRKIFETILVFLCLLLLFCFGFSLSKLAQGSITASELLSTTILYFLYTIGYGALEGDSFLQNIFAMVGIVSLSLMSTFLTINLFWRTDDVLMKKRIDVNTKTKKLSLQFQNKGKTICDVKASFLIYDPVKHHNILCSDEISAPLLFKNNVWDLEFDLNETFWYKMLIDLLTTSHEAYVTYSFVDSKNGQSSIKVERIQKDFLFCGEDKLRLSDLQGPEEFDALLPIECEGTLEQIDDSYHYDLSGKKGFVMLYLDFHQNALNLAKYPDTCYLSFTASAEKPLVLTMEIKDTLDGKSVHQFTISDSCKIKLPISEINCDREHIKEICFTIFPRGNAPKNTFRIEDVTLYWADSADAPQVTAS